MENKEHISLQDIRSILYADMKNIKNEEISLLKAKVFAHILKCEECNLLYETLESNIENKLENEEENKPKTI